VTTAPTQWLTGNPTIFGEVTEGYEVVEAVSRVPTGPCDRERLRPGSRFRTTCSARSSVSLIGRRSPDVGARYRPT